MFRSINFSIAAFLSISALILSFQFLHLSNVQSKSQYSETESLSFQAPTDTEKTKKNDDVHSNPEVEQVPTKIQEVETTAAEIVVHGSCYPPRNGVRLSNTTNIYIELTWSNLHSETFYSFVNYFCSCNTDKYPQWNLDTRSTPHFYFGPEKFVKSDLRRILCEYNKTTCGPILIGKPLIPWVTLHNTTYATDWYGKNKQFHHLDKINQLNHLFICHNDAPKIEGATNIFFLTPAHTRYIVPSFFPPTIVDRSHRQLALHPNKHLVFLVLGSFYVSSGNPKRNIASLKQAMASHRDKIFTVHFLGGGSNKQTNDTLIQFVKEHFNEDYEKVMLTPNSEADVFMENVGNADVILPLVDETNFRIEYQQGKRLNSAISWGLGFHKRMVVYRPLAEVFGVKEHSKMFWLYESAMDFPEAFGKCLNYLSNQGSQS